MIAIATLPLILVPLATTPLATTATAIGPNPSIVEALTPDELEERLTAAGDDVAKLWEVRLWLVEEGRDEEARDLAKKIVELDPEHEAAHRALSHHHYDGQWFESYSALSKYRRAEEKAMLEKGLVRHGDGWAAKEDVPYLRMGWVKQDDGTWINGAVLERREREAKMLADGYQMRIEDSTWIHPDEFGNWTEGLWKCGEDWVGEQEANAYHANIPTWWEYTGEHFVIDSTCDREGVWWIAKWAELVYPDLVRTFGLKPETKPTVVVLNGVEQYNQFAAGDQAAGLPPTELDGHSSVHYAYFAEAWFDQAEGYKGSGVGWWDRRNESLAPYGQHSVRHAAAQSYIEAIDPSWDAISEIAGTGVQAGSLDRFWAEKKIPRWLRYGAASYVERYFVDHQVGEGGEPMWARQWAIFNLNQKGGLRTLERVFEFGLDVNDLEGSALLINEAGLVVAFLLDGECAPVIEAHQAFKAALKAGEDTTEQVQALQEALIKNEKKLAKFAQG